MRSVSSLIGGWVMAFRHCEEWRADASPWDLRSTTQTKAIHLQSLDCFALLAMTETLTLADDVLEREGVSHLEN